MELLEVAAGNLETSSWLLRMISEGMDTDDWAYRPRSVNCAHWILGHITRSRCLLLRILGLSEETADWEAAFNRGGDGAALTSAPSPGQLLATFHQSTEMIAARLRGAPTELLDQPPPFTLDFNARTIGDALFGLYMHETYHIGQVGLIRRMRGKKGTG